MCSKVFSCVLPFGAGFTGEDDSDHMIMINMDPKIELLHLYCVNVISTGAEGTADTSDDRLLFNGCQKHPAPSARPHQTPPSADAASEGYACVPAASLEWRCTAVLCFNYLSGGEIISQAKQIW